MAITFQQLWSSDQRTSELRCQTFRRTGAVNAFGISKRYTNISPPVTRISLHPTTLAFWSKPVPRGRRFFSVSSFIISGSNHRNSIFPQQHERRSSTVWVLYLFPLLSENEVSIYCLCLRYQEMDYKIHNSHKELQTATPGVPGWFMLFSPPHQWAAGSQQSWKHTALVPLNET